MDLNTGLVIAAGAVILIGGGGYRYWLWHRQFRQTPKVQAEPAAQVKPKRKYTRKPKPEAVNPNMDQNVGAGDPPIYSEGYLNGQGQREGERS